MVLQSAVSLTFGLAFFGLWKGFQRPAAGKWAVAWIVYATGVVFSALGVGFGFGTTSPPIVRALLQQPLLLGVVLFRAGTDALVDEFKVERYVVAGAAVLVMFIAVREADARGLVAMSPSMASYILPRIAMGVLYAWAAWPLRLLARKRWAEGYTLMAAALACLSVRMFVSAGYDLWQTGHGATARAENPWLTVAQLAFLIAFGVATAFVLVEASAAVQRRLEAAVQQSSRMDSLGRMARGVSHDFNNMLAVMSAGVELAMAEIPEGHPSRRDLTLVREAAVRGETLTRQLATFARDRPPASERFDVRDRLASLERVIAVAVGGVITIRMVHADQPLFVRADPGQFDQAIMNLAMNARDAMPSAGRLTIQSAQDAGWARVVVEDTGVGIPAANLDRIFEPFFTTKAEGKGSGLGLANAYAFARQAGGSLGVESQEGVGTRFSLSVPLDA